MAISYIPKQINQIHNKFKMDKRIIVSESDKESFSYQKNNIIRKTAMQA